MKKFCDCGSDELKEEAGVVACAECGQIQESTEDDVADYMAQQDESEQAMENGMSVVRI